MHLYLCICVCVNLMVPIIRGNSERAAFRGRRLTLCFLVLPAGEARWEAGASQYCCQHAGGVCFLNGEGGAGGGEVGGEGMRV